MSNKQQISALMDGELVDQALISELENDVELQASWDHFHLIGDALRGDVSVNNGGWDIAANVALALEDEPTHSTHTLSDAQTVTPMLESQPEPSHARRKMPGWLSQLTQVGVAACVSLFVIIGVQNYSTQSSTQSNDSDVLPVLNTIPFSGEAEPVSLTNNDSGLSQSKEAQTMQEHRRVNALVQDYELQLRLNHTIE